MVQVFGPLQNREVYKKVKLHNREDNKKSCKNIYPWLYPSVWFWGLNKLVL